MTSVLLYGYEVLLYDWEVTALEEYFGRPLTRTESLTAQKD